MSTPDEFYIGYTRSAPPRVARRIRRTVCAIFCGAACLALLVIFAQKPFPAASFEYGHPRTLTGVIRETPFPHADLDAGRSALLVAPGKHGAGDLIRGLDGRRVDFSATRIQRDGDLMLELMPGSLRPMAVVPVRAPEWIPAGAVELRGEIVDSKCYLGVMNPGDGKVHRDCAARCISGGVPPAIVVRDANGRSKLLPLTGPHGASINQQVLPYVAEPVIVRGTLFRSDDRFRIEVPAANIRRAE